MSRPRLLLVASVAALACLSSMPAASGRTAGATHSPARRLHLVKVIDGDITPKSVGWSERGLVFAQNMIYRHTVTVYGPHMRLRKTISDAVRLSRKGYPQYDGVYHGGPVEVAFSPDRSFAYVSNYSMYGPDLRHPGFDDCTPSDTIDRSFVYRIGLDRLRIGPVIRVGRVPKVVAVTPDNRYVLVTNWCSWDLSVVSVALHREVRRIDIGRYPRGIAIGPRGRIAYVAVMGSDYIAKVNLRTFAVHRTGSIGLEPRALVMSPHGRFLYATLNGEESVVKIDLRSERVVGRVHTGSEPRSMTIAPDGRSLYVVNYESASASKVRTRDMHVVQTVGTRTHPIGITYDGAHHRVWVACYSGSLMVFKDALPG
jgi:YVTN family beta-propeller protein